MTYDFDLATVWAFIIAFAIFAYVVMDGFDLGIGILFAACSRSPGSPPRPRRSPRSMRGRTA